MNKTGGGYLRLFVGLALGMVIFVGPEIAGATQEVLRPKRAADRQSWEARVGAVAELARRGPAATPDLIQALNDEDRDVRIAAAFALGHIGTGDAAEALATRLQEESQWDMEVRMAIALALGRLHRHPQAIEAIEMLRDVIRFYWAPREAMVSEVNIATLGRIQADKATEVLNDLLSEEGRLRSARHRILQEFRQRHRLVDEVQEALKSARVTRGRSWPEEAIATLGEIGTPRAAQVLRETLLEVRNPSLREAAARELGKGFQRRSAVKALEEALKTVASWEVYEAIIDALINLKASVPLISLLKSDRGWPPGPLVHKTAAKALGYIGNQNAVPALKKALLNDPEPSVKEAAAWALGQIGGAQAIEALQGVVNNGYLPVRIAAVNSLITLLRPPSKEFLHVQTHHRLLQSL